MQDVSHLPASSAYSARFAELEALVEPLPGLLPDAAKDAHSAHWGHVGDATRAVELAAQLTDLLRGMRVSHNVDAHGRPRLSARAAALADRCVRT